MRASHSIRKTSAQSEALALIVDEKSYSNPRSADFRRELASTVIRTSLPQGDLISAVRMNIQALRAIPGTHSLEIADLIKAVSIMHPGYIIHTLQGVRGACIRHDHYAAGIALGAFEATNVGAVSPIEGTGALAAFLVYALKEEFWTGKECIIREEVKGRLSEALLRSFAPDLWIDGIGARGRLDQVCSIVSSGINEELDTPMSRIDTLHDYLINEMTARIVYSAPPAYRLLILEKGLKATLEEREAELSARSD